MTAFMLIDANAVPCSIARWARRVLWLLSMATLTTACASLPDPVPRADTHALADYKATDLGRLTSASAPGPDVSGLRLLSSGDEALGSLAAAELAQRPPWARRSAPAA